MSEADEAHEAALIADYGDDPELLAVMRISLYEEKVNNLKSL